MPTTTDAVLMSKRRSPISRYVTSGNLHRRSASAAGGVDGDLDRETLADGTDLDAQASDEERCRLDGRGSGQQLSDRESPLERVDPVRHRHTRRADNDNVQERDAGPATRLA